MLSFRMTCYPSFFIILIVQLKSTVLCVIRTDTIVMAVVKFQYQRKGPNFTTVIFIKIKWQSRNFNFLHGKNSRSRVVSKKCYWLMVVFAFNKQIWKYEMILVLEYFYSSDTC